MHVNIFEPNEKELLCSKFGKSQLSSVELGCNSDLNCSGI